MKRAALILTVAAAALSLAACHRGSADQKNPDATGKGPEVKTIAAQMEGATCRAGWTSGSEAQMGIAKVVPAQLHFIDDSLPNCPDDTAACQTKTFAKAGDVVLTGVAKGPYLCVAVPGKAGAVGWIKPDQVAAVAVNPTPTLAAWAGSWRKGGDSITLTVKDAALVAAGEAHAPGFTGAAAPAPKPAANPDPDLPAATPPPPVVPAGLAKFAGVVTPAGNTLEIADPAGCRVNLKLMGPFVLASDNGQCGGGTVKFAGIYRKGGAPGAGKPDNRTGAVKSSNPNTTVFY